MDLHVDELKVIDVARARLGLNGDDVVAGPQKSDIKLGSKLAEAAVGRGVVQARLQYFAVYQYLVTSLHAFGE
jgi:hypothetical protein